LTKEELYKNFNDFKKKVNEDFIDHDLESLSKEIMMDNFEVEALLNADFNAKNDYHTSDTKKLNDRIDLMFNQMVAMCCLFEKINIIHDKISTHKSN
jgi:hypothetical protein